MFLGNHQSGRHNAVVRIDLSNPDNQSFENVGFDVLPKDEYLDGTRLGLFSLNVEKGEVLIADVVRKEFHEYAIRLANTYTTSIELSKILAELKNSEDERSIYNLRDFLQLLDSHYTKIIDFYKNTDPNHVNYRIACDAWNLVMTELKIARSRINVSLSTEAVIVEADGELFDALAFDDTNVVLADTAVSDRN